MLEEVLRHLNNWFLMPDGIHEDTYKVEGGTLALPFLANSQYFRIIGSVFNDGLHQYPATDLTDETFDGFVWALAVPKQVISLADEISAWQTKNSTAGPFVSESFGGYSYTRATNASGLAGCVQVRPERIPQAGQSGHCTAYQTAAADV